MHALTKGVLRHQPFQLGHELCATSRSEVGVDAVLEHGEPLVLEPPAVLVGVGAATAATGPTAQGLRADGLRWQGVADHYGRLQGIRADGRSSARTT